MKTLSPNQVVTYDGTVAALRTGPGYSVIDTIPHGLPIGNGETNNSGENLVRCQSLYSGVIFLFRQSELKV